MASKKKGKPDQHKSGFMVRLPEAYREKLEEVAVKNRRTMTVETQIALDKHFQAEGIEPPPRGG